MLYDGGESSRIYDGEYVLELHFEWPWGQPGYDEIGPEPYEDAAYRLRMLGAAVPWPVTDPDTGVFYPVRITRALIRPA